jgi:hypothetical protein
MNTTSRFCLILSCGEDQVIDMIHPRQKFIVFLKNHGDFVCHGTIVSFSIDNKWCLSDFLESGTYAAFSETE